MAALVTEPKLGANTGNRGKGRPKGVPNKLNAALKDMILTALNESHTDGGVGYLKAQALDNPTAFLTLVGKVLPLDVNANVEAGARLSKVIREIVRAPHTDG